MTSSRRIERPSVRRRGAARGVSVTHTVRRATVADIGVLVEHRRRMFASIARWSAAAMARHDRAYRAWVRPRLLSGEVHALVVSVDDVPAASGVLWWREDQPRPGIGTARLPYVMSIFTEPKLRGRGLASRIVRDLVGEARRGGASRVTLHASEMGRSVYTEIGFERTWEMRKWLDPRYVRARATATQRAVRARAGSRA